MTQPLSNDVLDLLVDGPSHVAGLYGSLVRVLSPVPVGVGEVVEAIRELDDEGHVRLWFNRNGVEELASARARDLALERYEEELPLADPNASYHDEIGLWCEITAGGRARWSEAGYSEELDGVLWTLDESRGNRSITIRAETQHAAERVLAWWLDRHPEVGSADAVTMRPLSIFTLKDGTVLERGVELTCRLVVSESED